MAQNFTNLVTSANPMGTALSNKINPPSSLYNPSSTAVPASSGLAKPTGNTLYNAGAYLAGGLSTIPRLFNAIGGQVGNTLSGNSGGTYQSSQTNSSTPSAFIPNQSSTPTNSSPSVPLYSPLASNVPTSNTSTNSNSSSNGISSGGLPLASGVTPITTVAQAQQAGQAYANKNNPQPIPSPYTPPVTTTPTETNTSGQTINPYTGQIVSSSTTPNPNGLYGQAIQNIGNVANQGSNNITNSAYNNPLYGPASIGALNNLSGTATTAQDIGNYYGNQIGAINTGAQNQATGDLTSGGTSPVSTGLAGQAYANASGRIAGLSAAEQAALAGNSQAQTAYSTVGSQALTGQGQQIGASTSAASNALTGASNQAGYLAPSNTNAQVPYSNQYINASTGQPVTGSNPALDNAVQTALQLVKNGASVNDPQVQSILSPFGTAGAQAFNNAQLQGSNGTYNPTSQASQVQQNQTQGQQFQGQAATLNTTLNQLNQVKAPILSLINGAGLNQTSSPNFNESINNFSAQLGNTAAQASLKAGIGEIQTYVAQILGSSGDLTPTQVTALTNSFDPGNFNATQLSQFLDLINNYGQSRLAPLQQASQGSYSATGAYTGAPATPSSTSIIPTPNAPLNPNIGQVGQATVGTAMGGLGAIENLIQGASSKILGSL